MFLWFGSVFTVFLTFLAELNSVGEVEYTILSAFTYIVLQLPEVAYRQASPIILLGCILGMGHLATTGQLLIFRVSGVSILKITLLTLKNSLIFVLFFIFIGEFLAPTSSSFAESSRSNCFGKFWCVYQSRGFLD